MYGAEEGDLLFLGHVATTYERGLSVLRHGQRMKS
jgi:hypothetical protein